MRPAGNASNGKLCEHLNEWTLPMQDNIQTFTIPSAVWQTFIGQESQLGLNVSARDRAAERGGQREFMWISLTVSDQEIRDGASMHPSCPALLRNWLSKPSAELRSVAEAVSI